jgi:hypothetical protein
LIEHWDEPDTLDIFTRIGAEARLGQPPACGDPKNWPYGDRPMQVGKPFAVGLPVALGIGDDRGGGAVESVGPQSIRNALRCGAIHRCLIG